MKNTKLENLLLAFVLIFIISIVISFLTKYPDNTSSYAIGFSTGFVFGQAVKILGAIGLIAYGISKIRKKGIRTLK